MRGMGGIMWRHITELRKRMGVVTSGAEARDEAMPRTAGLKRCGTLNTDPTQERNRVPGVGAPSTSSSPIAERWTRFRSRVTNLSGTGCVSFFRWFGGICHCHSWRI